VIFTHSVRWFGMLGLLAGVLNFLSVGLDVLPSGGPIPFATVELYVDMSAAIFIIFALIGIYLHIGNQVGKMGLSAFIASMVGATLVIGIKWMRIFAQPLIIEHYPSSPPALLQNGLNLSFAIFGLGMLFFAVVIFLSNRLPRWGVVMLMLSAALEFVPGIGYLLAKAVFGIGLLVLCSAVWNNQSTKKKVTSGEGIEKVL
jgi:hypothetical protein